jgi:hypothetical protein
MTKKMHPISEALARTMRALRLPPLPPLELAEARKRVSLALTTSFIDLPAEDWELGLPGFRADVELVVSDLMRKLDGDA